MNINMNNGMFGIFGEPVEYSMKVWIGDAIVENKKFQMPSNMARQQFEQLVRQLVSDKQPMKLEFLCKTDVVGSENIDTLTFTNKIWDKAHDE